VLRNANLSGGGNDMNGTITIRRIEQKDIESIMALGQWLITRHDMIAIDPGGPFDLSLVSEID